MDYRQLGRSGLRVSVLALGTMTFGGRGNFAKTGALDVAGATQLLDLSLDAGVNLVDTADVYSGGLAEEILGEIMHGRRNRLVVATKARFRMGDGPNDAGLSRKHLIEACEASLRRLRTDHIDLYQIHQWDGQTPLEETMGALDALVRAGKVRYLGASNLSAWHLMKALGVADRSGGERFVAQQIHYSAQAREAEYELLPLAIDQGVGVLVWAPLAGGLLSGKYRRGQQPPEGTRHFANWNEPPIHDEAKLYDIIETIVAVAAARGASPAQVALAWLLGRPGVASLIVGARTGAQLADNLGAANVMLTAEEREKIDAVSALPLLYPYWHQARAAHDRLGAADLSLLAPHLKR